MGDKSNYRKGEKVEETGTYVCEICNTEGGVHAHEFKEGDEFCGCMNCGDSTSWKKTDDKKVE